jgi:hypothetical protein
MSVVLASRSPNLSVNTAAVPKSGPAPVTFTLGV